VTAYSFGSTYSREKRFYTKQIFDFVLGYEYDIYLLF